MFAIAFFHTTILCYIERLEKEINALQDKMKLKGKYQSDIYPVIPMPTNYGPNNSYEVDNYKSIPPFDPLKDNIKLLHLWQMLITTGEKHDKLSQSGFKNLLLSKLRGEAIDYFLCYQNDPLIQLIPKLIQRFDKRTRKSDYALEVRNFERREDESLLEAIQRLKYYLRNAYTNKSDLEMKFYEQNILEEKLQQGMVSKDIWKTVIKRKRRAQELEEDFDIEQACLLEEDIYKDCTTKVGDN